MVLYKAKSNHDIDMLIWAPNNIQEYMAKTLAHLRENVIDYLITICAQPIGIQGVKLVKGVIRLDSF